MRRGDVVVVATGSGFGRKPRPALLLQDDAWNDVLDTVVVAPFTSDLDELPLARPRYGPSGSNGLHEKSDLMVEIIVTARRERVGKVIGA